MEPEKRYGERDAQKVIEIYGPELALLATAAIEQYPDMNPPGAIICEPGTSEGESLKKQLDPRMPIRVVDDGVALVVLSQKDLHGVIEKLAPGCLDYLDQPELSGTGVLPVFAICRAGCLLGVAEMPNP